MLTQPIYQELPEFYRKFLPDFFEEMIPIETSATCSDCVMCLKPGDVAVPGVAYFKPNAKCCSYFPKLPNYLVGGLLSDSNPAMDEGRRRIRERIRNRIGITPVAIDSSKKYNLLLKFGGVKSFGRNASLVCPYFVNEGGGSCSIWKFRESVCATYFCKTVAGKQGQKFWHVFRSYLNHVQETLSWYALDSLNWDVQVVWDYVQSQQNDDLAPEDLDETGPDEEIYRNLWRDWLGREEDFYRECFRVVTTLTKEEFDQHGGIRHKTFLKWVEDARNDVVHPKIPPVLKKNPELKVFETPDGKVTVLTHVGFYSIQKILFEVLGWFDGVKTTAEIQKMVYEKYQADLNDDYIVPMFFNQMIIPA